MNNVLFLKLILTYQVLTGARRCSMASLLTRSVNISQNVSPHSDRHLVIVSRVWDDCPLSRMNKTQNKHSGIKCWQTHPPTPPKWNIKNIKRVVFYWPLPFGYKGIERHSPTSSPFVILTWKNSLTFFISSIYWVANLVSNSEANPSQFSLFFSFYMFFQL